MRVHHFYAGDHETHDGRKICEACGDVESAKVHEVPVVDDVVREIDARKLGETHVLS